VAGALDEEPWAPAAIWDRYAPLVRRVLRRAVGPGPGVEDLLQEVFVQFFRSVRKLADPGALRPFLIGITLRVSASERRRRRFKRWLTLSPSGELPERATAPHDEHARAALRRFYAILDDLDEQGRAAFILRHVEQLDLAEIAEAMGISLATVKRRLAKVTPIVAARVRADELLAPWAGAGASFDRASGTGIRSDSVLDLEEVGS
jgi:RNA polymerase sigma-70 factor (ECF subfamily)